MGKMTSRALHGVGVSAASPLLAFDTTGTNPPNPDDWGSTSVDTLHTFLLRNTGSAGSSTITVSVTGNASEWTKGTDTCNGQTLAASASCTIQMTFIGSSGTPGSYSATLQASATSGGTTTNTLNGTRVNGNAPPVCGADQSIGTTLNTPVVFDLNAASDPNADPVTYVPQTMTAHGTMTNCAGYAGSTGGGDRIGCTYTPNGGYTGSDTFTYFAFDGQAYSSLVGTVSFTVSPPPPPAPGSLVAVGGLARIDLSWNAAAGATSYLVYRGTTGGSHPTFLGATAGTGWPDTGLGAGVTYYYVVDASNSGGQSGDSNEASASTTAIPAAPSASGTPGNQSAHLSWGGVGGATGYTVKRGGSSGSYDTTIPLGNVTSYDDNSALTNTVPYYYVVTASNAAGTSGYSNEVVVTPTPPPNPPQSVSAANSHHQKVTLSWFAPSNTTPTQYKIYYGTSSGSYPFGPIVVPYSSSFQTYDVTGLTNCTTYYFVVTAENSVGVSGYSFPEVAGTPRQPPVTTTASPGPGTGHVTVTWSAVAGANAYQVVWSTTSMGGGTAQGVGNVTTANLSGPSLSSGTLYYFRVQANVNCPTTGYDITLDYLAEATATPP
jgi:fibronectin type 3 domain-containing protein